MERTKICLSVFSILCLSLSCSTKQKKSEEFTELNNRWPFICRQIKSELRMENPVITKKVRKAIKRGFETKKKRMRKTSFHRVDIKIPPGFTQSSKDSDLRTGASSVTYSEDGKSFLTISQEPNRSMPKVSRFLLSHTQIKSTNDKEWTHRIFGEIPSWMSLYRLGHHQGLDDLSCKKGSRKTYALAIALIQRSIHQNWDGDYFELLSHPRDPSLFLKIGSFSDPDFKMRAEIRWLERSRLYSVNIRSEEKDFSRWIQYFYRAF